MLGSTTITTSLHGGTKRYQTYKYIFSNGLCFQASEKTVSKVAISGCKNCGFKFITGMNYLLIKIVFHLKPAY